MNLKTMLKNPVVKFSLGYLLFNFIIIGSIILSDNLYPPDETAEFPFPNNFVFFMSLLYIFGIFDIVFYSIFINKKLVNYKKSTLKFIIIFLTIQTHILFFLIYTKTEQPWLLFNSFIFSIPYYLEFLIIYFIKKRSYLKR